MIARRKAHGSDCNLEPGVLLGGLPYLSLVVEVGVLACFMSVSEN